MKLLENIGMKIRDLRINYNNGEGISQEALAKALGVTPNTISRWETATYRPSIDDLDKLARFFGVSIMEFFPPEEALLDDNIAALMRTAKQLPREDIEELRKYAEFRRARNLYAHGTRPRAGRTKKNKDDK